MPANFSRFFGLPEHGTTFRREILGGVTTFLTMSYIIFVQPGVLAQAGMDFNAVLSATCLSAALATFLMGLVANYPVALAPGMGENFFFVYTLCGAAPLGFGLDWKQALGAVFLAGVFFVILTLTGLRARIVNSIPRSLKCGIAAGIGLFVTFIGLEYGGWVVGSPGTLVRLGDFRHPATLVSVAGVLLILVLSAFRVRGAILLGILATTGLAAVAGLVHYQGAFSAEMHLAPTFFAFDFRGLFGLAPGKLFAALFVLFYLALFDTIGTLVGVGQQAGLMREGKLARVDRALFSDAVGTTVGAALGTSTLTCFIESAAGVADGARTGLANLITGVFFLAAMLASPLARMIGGGVSVDAHPGGRATVLYPTLAPALIVVGAMMLKIIRELNWDEPTEYLPAFLILVGIPLTFSIANGIALGLIAYAVGKVFTGRWRECPALTYVFAALFVLQFLII